MRWFKYLLGRLHLTGWTWLAAALTVLLLIPFLGAGLQPVSPTATILRDPSSPLYEFRFQRGFAELAPDHLREDHLREVSAYLLHLRQSRTDLRTAGPEVDDRAWADYLDEQEALHLQRLWETHGLIDQETYYFGRYAPFWIPRLTDPELAGADLPDRAELMDPRTIQWDELTESLLRSEEPLLAAMGRNLQGQLPLVPVTAASSRLLYLLQISRFLLALLPLIAFMILFGRRDRNFRVDSLGAGLKKSSLVFLIAASSLALMRLVWYGVLNLRFGDRVMHIVPPWAAQAAEPVSEVMTLRRFMGWITLTDLAFLLFFTGFLLMLHQILRDPRTTAVVGASALLLPRPVWTTGLPVFLDPLAHFSYLHQSLQPELFDHLSGPAGSWDVPPLAWPATPPEQIAGLLFSSVLFLASAWAIRRIRSRLTRPVRSVA